MELSKEEINKIAEALIKASYQTESVWLEIEKTILDSHQLSANENTNSSVREMWNQLYRKVEDAMKKMKKLED